MSTHAVICSDNTYPKGVYVHYDGYPEYTGASLMYILQRDGYDKTVKKIVNGYEWKDIDYDASESDENSIVIDGVGHLFVDSEEDCWVDINDYEFGYIIGTFNGINYIKTYWKGKYQFTTYAEDGDDAVLTMKERGLECE